MGARLQKDAVFSYLEGESARLRSEEKLLSADERGDEAIFARVRRNIFDAFCAVFSAGIKVCGDDEESLKSFFLSRTDRISQNWRDAREKAKLHADDEKGYIEEIKLKACADIRDAFIRIWRESL